MTARSESLALRAVVAAARDDAEALAVALLEAGRLTDDEHTEVLVALAWLAARFMKDAPLVWERLAVLVDAIAADRRGE